MAVSSSPCITTLTWLQDLHTFAEKFTRLKPRPGDEMEIPIPYIRFTHSGIDSHMVFSNDMHAGKSLCLTVYGLWQQPLQPNDVFLEIVIEGDMAFSQSNSQYATLRMNKGMCWDRFLSAKSVLRSADTQ